MTTNTIDNLRENRVFNSLDEEALEDLSGMVEAVTLHNGDVLFEKGDPGDHLYTINEGLLKISVTDSDTDRKKTLALIGEGEVVGEMAVFGNNKRSGKAIAIRETLLLRIPEDNFLNILSHYPKVGQNLIAILCERLVMTDEEIQSVTFQTVPGRLAAQLLRLADKFGTDLEDGRAITIELTHDQLGDLVVHPYDYRNGRMDVTMTWEGRGTTQATLTEMIELDSEGTTAISFQTQRLLPGERTELTIDAEERTGGAAAVLVTTPQGTAMNEALVLQAGEPTETTLIPQRNAILGAALSAAGAAGLTFVFVLRRKHEDEQGVDRIA